jgi:hypothetical protein
MSESKEQRSPFYATEIETEDGCSACREQPASFELKYKGGEREELSVSLLRLCDDCWSNIIALFVQEGHDLLEEEASEEDEEDEDEDEEDKDE